VGIKIRNGFAGTYDGDGALFSFVHDEEKDSDVFRVQMYLKYAPKAVQVASTSAIWPYASLELNLSSAPKEQDTNGAGAFRLRAGLEGDRLIAASPAKDDCSLMCLRGISYGAAAKFDSSQDSNIQKFSLELFASLVDSRIGAGMVIPPGLPKVSFFWQPTLLLEGGTTIREGESWERGSEFFRIGATLRASVHLDDLMRRMRLNAPGADSGKGEIPAFLPYLYAEYTTRFSFADEDTVFEYFKGGVHFPLNRNVGIDATYEQGELSPKFERVERVNVGLSVKF
jgi:hypothetical protein